MTEQRASEFIDVVGKDPELQKRIGALHGPTAVHDLTLIAAEGGYSFTESQYRAAVVAAAGEELSERSLEALQRELGL